MFFIFCSCFCLNVDEPIKGKYQVILSSYLISVDNNKNGEITASRAKDKGQLIKFDSFDDLSFAFRGI